MSVSYTPTAVVSGYNLDVINANFTAIQTALTDAISRSGGSPNSMSADIDMNSNNLTNTSNIYTDNIYVAGTKVTSSSAVPTWQGAWATSTIYALDDIVSDSGNSYICTTAHTSGTFATDLAANKWAVMATKGATGAGTGDMLAANNLSDVTTILTATQNLGLEVGVDVQAQNATLQNLAGLTQSTDQIPYFDSPTTAGVLDFLDEDTMLSNSATALASQQSIKAYADSVGALQTVSTLYTTSTTSSTKLPYDDTIPKNTEGVEFFTVSITPKSATSTLIIEVIVYGTPSGPGVDQVSCALFQDSIVNALAATGYDSHSDGGPGMMIIRYTMTSGTTSATTFKVRAGRGDNNTFRINGDGSSGARVFGGVLTSSIIVTEYA